MSHTLMSLVAQGVPLAPSLSVRLVALLVVEVFLLTLVVLLYVLWVRFKNEPLDEWWARRQEQGLSPKSLAEMEVANEERAAAEAAATPRPAAGGEAPTSPAP